MGRVNVKLKLFALLGMIIFASIFHAQNAQAKDCGVIGTVYPIAEPDLLDVLNARLLAAEKNGTLDHLREKMQQDLQAKIARPDPVDFLKATTTPRSFLFNPSVTCSADIKDSNGRVLMPAGTVINPLNTTTLNTTLVFYNADSPAQAAWATEEDAKLSGNDILILVGGSVFDETKRLKKRVYFDQGGMLSERFGIQQVPAIVTQEGHALRIDEVTP